MIHLAQVQPIFSEDFWTLVDCAFFGLLFAQPCLVAAWLFACKLRRWQALVTSFLSLLFLSLPFGFFEFDPFNEHGGPVFSGLPGQLAEIVATCVLFLLGLALASFTCYVRNSILKQQGKSEGKRATNWSLILLIVIGLLILLVGPPSIFLFWISLSLLSTNRSVRKTLIRIGLFAGLISLLGTGFFALMCVGDNLKEFEFTTILRCAIAVFSMSFSLVAGLLIMRRAGYRIDHDLTPATNSSWTVRNHYVYQKNELFRPWQKHHQTWICRPRPNSEKAFTRFSKTGEDSLSRALSLVEQPKSFSLQETNKDQVISPFTLDRAKTVDKQRFHDTQIRLNHRPAIQSHQAPWPRWNGHRLEGDQTAGRWRCRHQNASGWQKSGGATAFLGKGFQSQ